MMCPSESKRDSPQVVPAINRFTESGVEFADGRKDFDAVILATGYKSNVPSWLKVRTYANVYVYSVSKYKSFKDFNK